MNTDIKSVLNRIQPITSEAWEDLEQLFHSKVLQKNEYFLREGERAHHCYYLEDGVVRVFYTKDGNEYNKTLFVGGMFPTPITALLTDSPANISFQALTECKVTQFSYASFRSLFEKHKSLMALMLTIMEQLWIKKEQHDIRMVTNDATTNYLLFRDDYPGLEALIPQYHISSYLGITPIQLSRIRAQLRENK